MMIEIEKNVPLPPAWGGKYLPGKYPWKELQVGDSFVLPKPQAQAGAQAFLASRQIGNGVKFTTRKIDAQNKRVWRIA